MPMQSLQDLYINKLNLILDAERQGLTAMAELGPMVSNEQLRETLEMHQAQTEDQARQVERLIEGIGPRQAPTECISMQALIQEGRQLVQRVQDPDARDALLIAAVQGVEHHEIAAYGTARTWAQQLGRDKDAQVLQQILDEEKTADLLLSEVAERMVNREAAQGAERDVTPAAEFGDMEPRASRGEDGATGTAGTAGEAEETRPDR